MADFFTSMLAVGMLFFLCIPLFWYIFHAINVNQELSDEAEYIYWSDDHWQTDGALKLHALEHIDNAINIPEKLHSLTIEEYLIKHMNRTPKSGDQVKAFGLVFSVITLSHRTVDQVHIFPDPDQSEIPFNLQQ